jgi:hypothetical protein
MRWGKVDPGCLWGADHREVQAVKPDQAPIESQQQTKGRHRLEARWLGLRLPRSVLVKHFRWAVRYQEGKVRIGRIAAKARRSRFYPIHRGWWISASHLM